MSERCKVLFGVIAFLIVGVLVCTTHARQLRLGLKTLKRRSNHTLVVTSDAFEDGKKIPEKYTCDGENISPQIAWSNVPEKAKTIALICDDPDAPRNEPWVHWIIFNIPAGSEELPSARATELTLADGACQGTNSFGKIGYGGACPPVGHGKHRYFFQVYALDAKLDLEAGATKNDLETAMIGHVLATGELMGTYSRD